MALTVQHSVFLHYLDFYGAAKDSWKNRFPYKRGRFKFDLLAYPEGRFLVAAPAIAKCPSTARLMSQCDTLWRNGRIAYVLSPEYEGDMGRYMRSRIARLETAFSPEALSAHFEYCGYTKGKWHEFALAVQPKRGINHIDRIADCDDVFRKIVGQFAENNLADVMAAPTEVVSEIAWALQDLSEDTSRLFQREIALETIASRTRDRTAVRLASGHLDRLFGRANAICAAANLPLERGEMDGTVLFHVTQDLRVSLFKCFPDVIAQCPPEAVIALSATDEWRAFAAALDDAFQWTHSDLLVCRNEAIKQLRASLSRLYFERAAAHFIAAGLVKKVMGAVGDEVLLRCGLNTTAIIYDAFFPNHHNSPLSQQAGHFIAGKARSEGAFRALGASTGMLTGPIEEVAMKLMPSVGNQIIKHFGSRLRDGYKGVLELLVRFAKDEYQGLPHYQLLQASLAQERGWMFLR